MNSRFLWGDSWWSWKCRINYHLTDIINYCFSRILIKFLPHNDFQSFLNIFSINPLTPLPPVKRPVVITFDQNWHHLYLTSAGGKVLCSDTQIRVIGSVELEICTKMLGNLSEKLGAKFPTTTHGFSLAKIGFDGFSFWKFLNGSKPSRRSITAGKR